MKPYKLSDVILTWPISSCMTPEDHTNSNFWKDVLVVFAVFQCFDEMSVKIFCEAECQMQPSKEPHLGREPWVSDHWFKVLYTPNKKTSV